MSNLIQLCSPSNIGDVWCRLMHDKISWPVHGVYHCLTCGRVHEVTWNQNQLSTGKGRISDSFSTEGRCHTIPGVSERPADKRALPS